MSARCFGTLLDDLVHFFFSKLFFWHVVDTNQFWLESTNPKKNSQTLDAFQMSEWFICYCLWPNRLFVWVRNAWYWIIQEAFQTIYIGTYMSAHCCIDDQKLLEHFSNNCDWIQIDNSSFLYLWVQIYLQLFQVLW